MKHKTKDGDEVSASDCHLWNKAIVGRYPISDEQREKIAKVCLDIAVNSCDVRMKALGIKVWAALDRLNFDRDKAESDKQAGEEKQIKIIIEKEE